MKKNRSKILATCLSFLVVVPVLYLLLHALPENGLTFWQFIERFSQWKPAFLKGAKFFVFFVFYLAALGIFIFVAKKELDK